MTAAAGSYDRRKDLILDQLEDGAAGRSRRAHQVAGVCRRLVQEAGDGVVDLRLGPPAGPVLREGRCQQRIQLCAGIIPKQLVGHVALRLGLSLASLALVIAEFMAAVVLSLASLASTEAGVLFLALDLEPRAAGRPAPIAWPSKPGLPSDWC